MLDIYVYVIISWVGRRRIRARRERELLAYRILGRLIYPDGVLCPGTPEEQKEAANGCSRESDHDRQPRVPRAWCLHFPGRPYRRYLDHGRRHGALGPHRP